MNIFFYLLLRPPLFPLLLSVASAVPLPDVEGRTVGFFLVVEMMEVVGFFRSGGWEELQGNIKSFLLVFGLGGMGGPHAG